MGLAANSLESNPALLMGAGLTLLGIFGVYMIGIIFFSYLTSVAIIRVYKNTEQNKIVPLKGIFNDSVKFILPFMGLNIVEFVAIVVLTMICAIPAFMFMFMSGMFSNFSATPPFFGLDPLKILVVISLFCLAVIHGLILTLFWQFSSIALLYSEKGIFESLKISFNLVKKNFWKVFGYTALIFVIMMVAMLVVYIPLGIISAFINLIPVIGPVIVYTIDRLIFMLVMPPSTIFFIKFYNAIWERKDQAKN